MIYTTNRKDKQEHEIELYLSTNILNEINQYLSYKKGRIKISVIYHPKHSMPQHGPRIKVFISLNNSKPDVSIAISPDGVNLDKSNTRSIDMNIVWLVGGFGMYAYQLLYDGNYGLIDEADFIVKVEKKIKEYNKMSPSEKKVWINAAKGNL